MVSVIGTTGTGFLQNDPCWRTLERLGAGELRSPFYLRIEVDDRPGVLAHLAERLAAEGVSVARLTQRQLAEGAALDVVTHDAPAGSVRAAAAAIAALPEVHGEPEVIRVVTERGV
jgi:homoserine dehydrogenase